MISVNNRRISYDDLKKMQEPVDNIVNEALDSIASTGKTAVKTRWQSNSIRISASIISLAASYMSMYYTYSWFHARLRPIQAMCMTIIIVGAILVIPQMIKVVIEKRSMKRYSYALMLSIILLVSGLFSMSTTIGTLYNNQSTLSIESISNIQKKEAINSGIESRAARRKRYEATSERASRDEERYTARIDILLSGGTVSSPEMSTLVSNRNKAQAARKEAEAEIDKLIIQEETYSIEASNISSERPDFITWIAGRFRLNRDNAELIMNAIPAIFVDVLAPAMLMVALFL